MQQFYCTQFRIRGKQVINAESATSSRGIVDLAGPLIGCIGWADVSIQWPG